MKKLLKIILGVSGLLIVFGFIGSKLDTPKPKTKPNVIYFFVDDLRPDLGCYGNQEIFSPNIDQIAKDGVLFTNQYVTVPTCGASRYSLLTGRLPRKEIHLNNGAFEKLMAPYKNTEAPESFVDVFRRSGYTTVGIGKVSHSADGYVYDYDKPKSDVLEMPQSWDRFLFNPGKWKTGWNAFFAYADGESRITKKGQVKPYEMGEVDDNGYPDGLTADLAIAELENLAKNRKPFFMGVGFFKPHLPFNAPKKYWDMYDENKVSLTPSPDIPKNVNVASLHASGEFNQYALGEEKASLEKPVSDEYARKLRHGYYASVSYSDALIGKVMQKLVDLGLDENTIIVVWGDHGWHLGDDRVWGKHTIFESALKSAFIVKVPNMQKGLKRNEIVSSVDIYPTLLDLCKIKKPTGLDGTSLVKMLKTTLPVKWNNAAFSYYKNGISIRNERYRYTKYSRSEMPNIELYDHKVDPNENNNIAQDNPKLIQEMEVLWKKGNTGIFDAKN